MMIYIFFFAKQIKQLINQNGAFWLEHERPRFTNEEFIYVYVYPQHERQP